MAQLVYPDLAIPLRNAIVGNNAIMTNMPPAATGDDNVYTRRPVPQNAPFPVIVIGPDIVNVDKGGLTDERLAIKRDIAIYATNDTAERYRLTEQVAFAVFSLFHRNPFAIIVPNWKVVQIWARGPMQQPVSSEDEFVARLVELTVELNAEMP